jgi:hypothetical protein
VSSLESDTVYLKRDGHFVSAQAALAIRISRAITSKCGAAQRVSLNMSILSSEVGQRDQPMAQASPSLTQGAGGPPCRPVYYTTP